MRLLHHMGTRTGGDEALTEKDQTRPFTVKMTGSVPITAHVPAFAWRCHECGWLGTGWTSEREAEREASDHLWEDHMIPGCRPDVLGDPHRWEEVPGTDSTDKCVRCGRYCGK